jgi:hypothetical protein
MCQSLENFNLSGTWEINQVSRFPVLIASGTRIAYSDRSDGDAVRCVMPAWTVWVASETVAARARTCIKRAQCRSGACVERAWERSLNR